jgi:predicted nicotinamide N-methyase
MTHPNYQTVRQVVSVAGAEDVHLQCLADKQQFYDPQGEAEQIGIPPAFWSLFAVVWPSALQLADLMARWSLQPNERVVEMGCGLALPSLVLHRRGFDVTATDFHPLTAQFLADNVKLNGLTPLRYLPAKWGAERQATDDQLALPIAERFDLLMGSDLLYERSAVQPLTAFIARHAQPNATVLIVDPDRGHRAVFKKAMRERGFSCEEKRLQADATAGREAFKGRLLTFSR